LTVLSSVYLSQGQPFAINHALAQVFDYQNATLMQQIVFDHASQDFPLKIGFIGRISKNDLELSTRQIRQGTPKVCVQDLYDIAKLLGANLDVGSKLLVLLDSGE